MTVQNPTPVLVTSVLTVPFHGDRLLLVEHQGEPYVPLRPITEALGLSWARQYRKLKEDPERWPVVALRATAEDGKNYEMVCLHLRKLPAWLYSISLKRIPDERVREKVRRYQLECDEVLWRYWFEERQASKRPALPETVEERLQLAERIVQGLHRLDLLDDQARLLYQEVAMNALAQLTGKTEPVDLGELWTLEELRSALAVKDRVWLRVRGRIGKAVKKRWLETSGGRPPRKIRKFVGGSFREVCAYPKSFFKEALRVAREAIPSLVVGQPAGEEVGYEE